MRNSYYPCIHPYYAYQSNYMPKPIDYKKPYHPATIKKHDCFNLADPAPHFTLEGIVGGNPQKVSLSDYKGKWVVLFFYGSDFTFV